MIPKEDWICDVCINFAVYGKYLRCPLCDKRGGAMKPTVTKADMDIFEYLNPSYHEFLRSYIKQGGYRNTPDKKPLTFKDINRKKLSRFEGDYDREEDEEIQSNFQEKLYYNFLNQDESQFTEEELAEEPKPYYVWAHISCALFIPELFFADRIQMTNISGIENIDSNRWKTECDVCRDKSKNSISVCNINFFPP